jgi:hypothetical protein
MKTYGGWSTTNLDLGNYMAVSGQLLAPAALYPGKWPPVPTV